MIDRRTFIRQVSLSTGAWSLLPAWPSTIDPDIVHTVNGPIPASSMGFTLTHEHVLVDFIGADKASNGRYDAKDAYTIALPKLQELKKSGCQTLVECTPAYLGRDVRLLQKLADASGLTIITNTGYYGATKEKFLPKHAYTESAEQLAARWINEFNQGIDGTGIKPGFIKTSTDGAPLTDTQRKLIKAAALTHLSTGLTMLVHTGNGAAAKEQLAILKEMGVDSSARVWTHAQNESDEKQYIEAAQQNGWVSFDGVSPETLDANVKRLQAMKAAHVLNHVLVSQDTGWYHVGEPSGGDFKSYACIADLFIPKLKANGFTEDEVDLLFKKNPAEAFAIKVRGR